MNQTHDDIQDLLAAYALDAVDGFERETVRDAVEHDRELQAELMGYREMLAVLATSVEVAPSTPSPDVWRGIENHISGDRAPHEAPSFTPARVVRRHRFTTRILGVVAASSLVAAAFFGVQLATLESPDLMAAADELKAQSSSRTVTLTDSGGLAVDVVFGIDGVGYVYADQLPSIADDRSYQLWAISDNGIISAGIFDPSGIAPFVTDGSVTGFAITEEVAGGVEASQNDPVAVWLDA